MTSVHYNGRRAWSIAAGRPASPDSGESFAFPEVLPREVLQFAEAPLKPLPDYNFSSGEGGTPRGAGGPLEESWMHHRCTSICNCGLPVSVYTCVLVSVWLVRCQVNICSTHCCWGHCSVKGKWATASRSLAYEGIFSFACMLYKIVKLPQQ